MMDLLLISDDYYLAKGMTLFFPKLIKLNGGSILSYYKMANNNNALVLIDDRIPDLKFYTLKTHERKYDFMILLKSGKEKKVSGADLIFDKIIDLDKKKSEIYDMVNVLLKGRKVNIKNRIINQNLITKKELIVLELLIRGATLNEISETTELSIQSIYRYRERIVNKYGFTKFSFFSSELISKQKVKANIPPKV